MKRLDKRGKQENSDVSARQPLALRHEPIVQTKAERQVADLDSTGGCNTPSAYAVSSVLHPPVESKAQCGPAAKPSFVGNPAA